MLGRYTPPAPLERGVLRCWVLVGNEVFLRRCLLGFSGCFGLRWLCSDVTHLLPLSRGEV